MLWTDRVFITTDDVETVDGEVNEVALSEKIVLSGRGGAIRRGIEEAGAILKGKLAGFGAYTSSSGLSANHLVAVHNTGLWSGAGSRAALNQICVSGVDDRFGNPIKQWALHQVLLVFYRNAFNRTTKDRYEGKMRFYRNELIYRVWPIVQQNGVPIVPEPLFAPGAEFCRNSGVWSAANVSLVNGSGASTARYDVAITYTSSNKYVSAASPLDGESHPTPPVPIAHVGSKVIQIDIASLNPPTGESDPLEALYITYVPLAATHWNVYVGAIGETMYLQNVSPIPVATKTYTLADDPVLSGYPSLQGQNPKAVLSIRNMRSRG